MISLRAVQLLLRHFDSIDETISRKLMRKRPWSEEALTSLFCDLLDKDTQEEEKIDYPLSSLMSDLLQIDEPLYLSTTIETHQYSKSVEHRVTQSDIGLIITYENQFVPNLSFSRSWLLQAKRLFPHGRDKKYDEKSLFSSRNSAQHERMKTLNDWAKCEFIRYLLYCPRPLTLDKQVRELLSYQRTLALAKDIFDYALGLQLRDDLISEKPTVAAGVFVSLLDKSPSNLKDVHRKLFQGSTPFSWFILQHFFPNQHGKEHWDLGSHDANQNNEKINKLVRGNQSVLQEEGLSDILEVNENFTLFPAHTITIHLVCGLDRPRNS
ncbi:hypothetical protein H6F74_10075 [Trichocoleus sp. FACHB-90]|uniref:hypothetical protein n=1 Tax=Cyanophyceae TaxID=3028117 RepID=UPI00168523C4|nr:hypothetical protein [Trichocoleus sp. FACHB-90]MBD1926588.1 hypothetical protein [Trichocoleus sp. FACHB-90]